MCEWQNGLEPKADVNLDAWKVNLEMNFFWVLTFILNVSKQLLYLSTGRRTHRIWPNEALPINSRIQVSASAGGSLCSSWGGSGVSASLEWYLGIWINTCSQYLSL